ncbi:MULTISPECIES: HamA C-terminal domain-containing protein [Acetobacter]|nr:MULTISPECIES: DUF1837 domain-containing protein [Acetobacter]ATJ91015.1 DUF1837 domain-containing protein [Acetobacter tropicalis]
MTKTILIAAPNKLDTRFFSWEPKRRQWKEDIFFDAESGRAFGITICSLLSVLAKAACRMINIGFETLIDESLSKITNVTQLKMLLNKRVLSLVNDFEDGKWLSSRFQSYLWDNIAQTALSERERLALADQSHSTLVAAARNLRLTDKDGVGQGSEIAEVFLYGIMKNHYKALPVVPKIFYKQNVQDNAKGADSVHIVVSEDGQDFTLWFGEAKFYNSIADARLDAVVNSVYASLNTGKLKKENAIITNVSDLDQLVLAEALRAKIKAALSSQVSIDHLKPKIHVPILIIHQCAETAKCVELSEEYRKVICAYHKERAEAYFSKQISESSKVHKYGDIQFHLILFPVPNKKAIVDTFLRAVSFYKGAA